MGKSLKELRDEMVEKYGTKNNTFDHFPIGTKVKIVTPCEDHYFFYEETGTVIANGKSYLSITVEFDKPRHFTDGYIQYKFGFNPQSLAIILPTLPLHPLEKFNEDMGSC